MRLSRDFRFRYVSILGVLVIRHIECDERPAKIKVANRCSLDDSFGNSCLNFDIRLSLL